MAEMKSIPKQPSIRHSKGAFVPKEVEEWAWRELFLRGMLAVKPPLGGPQGPSLQVLLLEDLRSLWIKAEREFKEELRGLDDGSPASAEWALHLAYGRDLPAVIEGYNTDWFRNRWSWPTIEAAILRGKELLRDCNLDQYLGEDGEMISIEWVQDSLIETIHLWLQLEFTPAFYDWMFKRHESGARFLFPLLIPREHQTEVQAWQDGGRKSPLGWEGIVSFKLPTGEVKVVPVTEAMGENFMEEAFKLHRELEVKQVSYGLRRREVTLSVTVPSFDPLSQTAAQWREDARVAFERMMDEHVEGMLHVAEAYTKAGAFTPTIYKRESEHFEWLARYQVGGESYSKIADSCGSERLTVRDAIGRTADLIGLPLRARTKGGRPRKPVGHDS